LSIESEQKDTVNENSHIVSRQLVSANYSVIRALKGKDALELYGKHRAEIRLVILDLLMPGISGKQFSKPYGN
jgi:CheY-like chemotaxis protein